MPPDHFDMIMAEFRGLRGEIHDWRREDKSEHVKMASDISELQAWKNKQAGALKLWQVLWAVASGLVGGALVKITGKG